MAQKSLDRQKLAALVRRWERVRDPKSLVSVAAQTAATLSHVHDVPSEVLEALDNSMELFGEKCGKGIYTVVHYLRQLQELERLTS